MKVESKSSTCESSSEVRPDATKRTLRALIRAFKVNNFTKFNLQRDSVCFAICLTKLVPEEVCAFPLQYTVHNSTVTLKIFFSRKKETFAFREVTSFCKLQEYVEEMNKVCPKGRFGIETSRQIVYLKNVIDVRGADDISVALMKFTNLCVKTFVQFISTLLDLANGTERLPLHLSPIAENIDFLQPQEVPSASDSEGVMLGFSFQKKYFEEIDYEAEIRIQKGLKSLRSGQFFAWDAMEIEEQSATAVFIAPKNCIAFDMFLKGGASSALMTSLQGVVETLASEHLQLDDLYERLYIQDERQFVLNPVRLAKQLRCGQTNYTAFWTKVLSIAATVLQKQHEVLSHSALWERIDPLWKLNADSLALHETQEGLVGLIGSKPVQLIPVRHGSTAEELVAELSREFHCQETRKRYGLTAQHSPLTGELVCYLVKDL